MPLSAPYKKRQYDGQTKTPDSFRLLLVEVLHGGKVFKNDDYRKEAMLIYLAEIRALTKEKKNVAFFLHLAMAFTVLRRVRSRHHESPQSYRHETLRKDFVHP